MLACVAGSTNPVIHLIAIAGHVGVDLPLALFDGLSRTTLVLVNLRPSRKYLMEDTLYAGGIPAAMKEMSALLHVDAITVSGKTTGENVSHAAVHDREVIGSLERPFHAEGGLVVLSGNLAPCGAVLKQTAASPHLLTHTGRAVVSEEYRDLAARVDDPGLEVQADAVLVVKSAGPKGAPGIEASRSARSPAGHHGQDLDRIPILHHGIQPAQEDAVPAVDQDRLQISGRCHVLAREDSPQQLLQPGLPLDLETDSPAPGQLAGLAVELDGDHCTHTG